MDFLNDVKGVLHIGANKGQASGTYNQYNLNVVWAEAIPHIYEVLKSRIAPFKKQIAFNACVTDKDDQEVTFHIINRSGLSSSIFELKDHKKMWPGVNESGTIKLKTTTVKTLVEKNNIDLSNYDAMVLDTQGSELLVLKGSPLDNIRYIMLEVANFEAYKGCCVLKDIEAFMKENNFAEIGRTLQKTTDGVGSYWDIVYKRG